MVGNTSWIQYGDDASNRTAIAAHRTSTGTCVAAIHRIDVLFIDILSMDAAPDRRWNAKFVCVCGCCVCVLWVCICAYVLRNNARRLDMDAEPDPGLCEERAAQRPDASTHNGTTPSLRNCSDPSEARRRPPDESFNGFCPPPA